MICLHDRRSELLKCRIEPLTRPSAFTTLRRDMSDTLPMNLVAADVRRFHLNFVKSEPPYVGCYGSGGQIANFGPWNLSPFGGARGALALFWQIK